jgi:hypothetical protein
MYSSASGPTQMKPLASALRARYVQNACIISASNFFPCWDICGPVCKREHTSVYMYVCMYVYIYIYTSLNLVLGVCMFWVYVCFRCMYVLVVCSIRTNEMFYVPSHTCRCICVCKQMHTFVCSTHTRM